MSGLLGGSDYRPEQRFKVFQDKSFEFYETFFSRKNAKLKAEELKLSKDIQNYRVEDEEVDGSNGGESIFYLWIH